MCQDHDRRPTLLRKSVHQAVVNVDEEGTEAAMIIIGVIQCTGKPPSNEFVSDHPITFFMME
uniref:Serpin domain-containing protein n=1 Tax=Aegilops tauschii subsp. strangulata TaxID=200361 RepID=A0A453NGP5_AEGTS